jgi:hypothetical protein
MTLADPSGVLAVSVRQTQRLRRRGTSLGCWVVLGRVPLATSDWASRYHALLRDASRRVMPVHFSEGSFHLLLPARESEYPLRVLGLFDVLHTFAQGRGGF